jgi:hypothetical protein
VPLDQVVYLKAELKYITVRTREREFLIEESLTSLEEEFEDRFVRIHRNALVARTRSPASSGSRRRPRAATAAAIRTGRSCCATSATSCRSSRRQWSVVKGWSLTWPPRPPRPRTAAAPARLVIATRESRSRSGRRARRDRLAALHRRATRRSAA